MSDSRTVTVADIAAALHAMRSSAEVDRTNCDHGYIRQCEHEADAIFDLLPASPDPLREALTPAIRDVLTERLDQDAKWGEQNHPSEVWLAILCEEVGEMAQEMLPGGSLLHCRDEAVQVAAVAIAFVEAIDRAAEYARLAAERDGGTG